MSREQSELFFTGLMDASDLEPKKVDETSFGSAGSLLVQMSRGSDELLAMR